MTEPDDLEAPDLRAVAELRAVAPTPPETRSRHVAAALAEYDALGSIDDAGAETPAGAPVVPLRRRPPRWVGAAAAAVVALLVGVGVVAELGGSDADQQADTASSESADHADDAGGSPADQSTLAGDGDGAESQAANRSADEEAGRNGADTPTVAPVAGPIPAVTVTLGDLGTFSTAAQLRDAVADRAAAGSLPDAAPTASSCPAAERSRTYVATSSATVAGVARVVWISIPADGSGFPVVDLVDPTTCEVVDAGA